MKLLLLLASLGYSTHAFQHSVQHTKPASVTSLSSAVFFYPNTYNRAVQCATHFETCDLDELEQLAHDLEEFQASETQRLFQGEEKMLEMQTKLQDYIHQHGQLVSSTIPAASFLDMLEQTLKSAQPYGQKNNMRAAMPFLDILETIPSFDYNLKRDNFAIPPSFLDILKVAIVNSRRLRNKADTLVIRPFVEILNAAIVMDDFPRDVRKRELPPFVDMLEQVV